MLPRSLRLRAKAEAEAGARLEQQASEIRTLVSRIDAAHNTLQEYGPYVYVSPAPLRLRRERHRRKGFPVRWQYTFRSIIDKVPKFVPSVVASSASVVVQTRVVPNDPLLSASVFDQAQVAVDEKERGMSASEILAHRAHKEKRRIAHRDWRYAKYAKRDGLTLAQVVRKYCKASSPSVAASDPAPSHVDASDLAPSSLDAEYSAIIEAIDVAQTLLTNERARRGQANARRAARRCKFGGVAALRRHSELQRRLPRPVLTAVAAAQRERRRVSTLAWRERKRRKLAAAEELLRS